MQKKNYFISKYKWDMTLLVFHVLVLLLPENKIYTQFVAVNTEKYRIKLNRYVSWADTRIESVSSPLFTIWPIVKLHVPRCTMVMIQLLKYFDTDSNSDWTLEWFSKLIGSKNQRSKKASPIKATPMKMKLRYVTQLSAGSLISTASK